MTRLAAALLALALALHIAPIAAHHIANPAMNNPY